MNFTTIKLHIRGKLIDSQLKEKDLKKKWKFAGENL